ncbi:hypothetical protein BP5796_07504 [Coleophoma crateriformis]|uniref:Uncharacterized protein n=1 Tax=Coleophoma crateriformis TaxID=565419 RepID=A0A3D8RJ44_9HELO|nr:hypothetical protein BP5796_07504 [Coleophoma crateriformis]
MDHLGSLPEPIEALQQSLQPYIKQRQQVETIRRTLALHLSQHVNPPLGDGELASRPLSLVHTNGLDTIPTVFRGLRKDYLRALRSNARAREEFAKASKAHRAKVLENQRLREKQQQSQDEIPNYESSTSLFLDVVKTKRQHEKLRILQDHVNILSRMPSATLDYIEHILALNDTSSLPRVPTELLASVSTSQKGNVDLVELVAQLEKSVFRAKLQLKREQTLLARIRNETDAPAKSSPAQKFQALAATRNELINWIETELSKAGETENEDSNKESEYQVKGRDYMENRISMVAAQYNRYLKARQALIIVAAGQTVQQPPAEPDHMDDSARKGALKNMGTALDVSSYYIENLMSLANEQKSTIQLKSHFTISFSKQLKELGYALDRLTHESHLLPTYPMTELAQQGKRLEAAASFAEETTKHEKPDSSSRARVWVFAAKSATNATNNAVLASLEDGEAAISEALQHLQALKFVLGTDSAQSHDGQVVNTNIWSILDGNLGAIKSEE